MFCRTKWRRISEDILVTVRTLYVTHLNIISYWEKLKGNYDDERKMLGWRKGGETRENVWK
jgi:hypothetical protein